MGPDFALQKAVRARLAASAGVTGLVPAAAILDRHQRPAPRPGIVLGETTMAEDDGLDRTRHVITHDLHIWTREHSLEGAKRIGAAVIAALRAGRLDLSPDHHLADLRVLAVRYMRDPDGESSHGVVTLVARVGEVTA